MKALKTTLIVASIFFALVAFTKTKDGKKHKKEKAHINFFHGTFAEAKQLASEQNKLIFFDAFASWCGPCRMMARYTFTNQKVADYYNANFINMKVDMEKNEEGPELSDDFDITAYPTLLFLDERGNIVEKEMGYYPAKEFLKMGIKHGKKIEKQN